jgi:hypothetical protein
VKASTRFGSRFVRNITGKSLKRVNDFLHINNLFIKGVSAGTKSGTKTAATAGAKVGSKGIVNLSKMVPLLGGIVGGGLNIVFTRQMGLLAVGRLKDGPPDGGKSRPNGGAAPATDGLEVGPTIDGAAEIVEDFVSSLPEGYTIDGAELGDDDASSKKSMD